MLIITQAFISRQFTSSDVTGMQVSWHLLFFFNLTLKGGFWTWAVLEEDGQYEQNRKSECKLFFTHQCGFNGFQHYIFTALVNLFIPRHWGQWWESEWDNTCERQQRRLRGYISKPTIKKTFMSNTNCELINNLVVFFFFFYLLESCCFEDFKNLNAEWLCFLLLSKYQYI